MAATSLSRTAYLGVRSNYASASPDSSSTALPITSTILRTVDLGWSFHGRQYSPSELRGAECRISRPEFSGEGELSCQRLCRDLWIRLVPVAVFLDPVVMLTTIVGTPQYWRP